MTLAAALRAFADDGDQIGTHYVGCWRRHQRCAMAFAAERLETADELLRAFRDQGAPGRVGRLILDDFLAGEGT